ncbi:hypothetical protein MBLNU459_g8551t1 [Dothideomycetes sp. NU459]
MKAVEDNDVHNGRPLKTANVIATPSIDPFAATTNNQLATPALTPITEHAADGDLQVPCAPHDAGDATLSEDSESPNGKKGGPGEGLNRGPRRPSDIERKQQQSNGLSDVEHTLEGRSGNVTHATTHQQSGMESKDQQSNGSHDHSHTLKLSPAQMRNLTSSPTSLPLRAASPILEQIPSLAESRTGPERNPTLGLGIADDGHLSPKADTVQMQTLPLASIRATPGAIINSRPAGTRSNSSPLMRRKHSTPAPRIPNDSGEQSQSRSRRPTLASLKLADHAEQLSDSLRAPETAASPMPAAIPLPPLSLPTYLQLELSSDRPSALYIHRSASSDFPYESSRVKFDRLLNFLRLPPQLELILWFGALACLDAWLYTFTILPLRFLKALLILIQWWVHSLVKEVKDIGLFIYVGLGRLWQRQKQASVPASRQNSVSDMSLPNGAAPEGSVPRVDVRVDDAAPRATRTSRKDRPSLYRHKRSKSTPSALLPSHKADLLYGLLIIFSCLILVRFDASRMYHSIRGQAAIKLYVIYNVLEVCDRLFSALGQDVLECLFSKETLERKPNGRSKVFRPLWMFMLALIYNVIHAAALFYQVITLNVAVNSYSNALLTLLMSNQFVEIKGTVFKKFEKENLFQLTCADVVERFQLWLMLLIIALRNIVEVGGLSMRFTGGPDSSTAFNSNVTGMPTQSTTILPRAFTLFPKWSGQVFGPFLIVLGSEMLVDWLKHAYINKFNSVKPDIYGRFLDVLTKDYYSHAFADQNLTKRLGLPVLPLACLFIRASVQTYHMFIATHMPLPIASTATALAVESASAETSPATTAALAHIDQIFRKALGRSSFGAGSEPTSAFSWWSLDDVIALATMLVFFLVLYFFLLAFKLVLGMCLLSFSRSRYRGMKEREMQSYDGGGRRVGGWGVVEVDEDKRRWIYDDDEEGLRSLREREAKAKEKASKGELKLDGVGRYMMAAKRIW